MEENTSITESNAASSEELAAAAEEMSAQAQELQRLVGQFKINDASVSKSETLALSAVEIAKVSAKKNKEPKEMPQEEKLRIG